MGAIPRFLIGNTKVTVIPETARTYRMAERRGSGISTLASERILHSEKIRMQEIPS